MNVNLGRNICILLVIVKKESLKTVILADLIGLIIGFILWYLMFHFLYLKGI